MEMQLANLGSACSTAITYAMLAIGMFAFSGCLFGWSQMLIHLCLNPVCFFGGPLVNKLGTKWSLVLGAMSFPIRGSSYYCNSKFGTQWVSELREKENLSSYAELTGAAPPLRSTLSSAVSSMVPVPAFGTLPSRESSCRSPPPAREGSTWLCGSSPVTSDS